MTDRKEFCASLWQLLKLKILFYKQGCLSSKEVGVIRILDEIMIKEVCLDILKNDLIASIKKFGFIDPVNLIKFYYKYYKDNGSKHKSAPKLLILLPKVLILTLSKIYWFN